MVLQGPVSIRMRAPPSTRASSSNGSLSVEAQTTTPTATVLPTATVTQTSHTAAFLSAARSGNSAPDHFMCYEVGRQSFPYPLPTATVTDQFGAAPRRSGHPIRLLQSCQQKR